MLLNVINHKKSPSPLHGSLNQFIGINFDINPLMDGRCKSYSACLPQSIIERRLEKKLPGRS